MAGYGQVSRREKNDCRGFYWSYLKCPSYVDFTRKGAWNKPSTHVQIVKAINGCEGKRKTMYGG